MFYDLSPGTTGVGPLESVGTDPVCDAENLQWLGGGFEGYGCLM